MCQATVFLDGDEIMKDVILVEPVEDGVRLSKFFLRNLIWCKR